MLKGNHKVAVVVPVYKVNMSDDELRSFRQTLRVLSQYPIILVHPQNLDVTEYLNVANDHDKRLETQSFEERFFVGLEGYNRLMLSEGFYRAFSAYEFVLICQLDVFVFRDELLYWCDKGYDYIGAPWVKHVNGETELVVGNGGCSLRRIRYYLDFFDSRKLVFPVGKLSKHINLRAKPYTRWLVWLLMAFGWRNRSHKVASDYSWNEDGFWSCGLDDSRFSIRKPEASEAVGFAFETYPSMMFELNQRQLPFACHAYKKHEYESFWKNYLESNAF